MWRLLLGLSVSLGLAPGTWVRSAPPPPDDRQILSIEPLALPAVELGPLTLVGAWQLRSPNRHFGAYSALVALGGGCLLAATDRGSMLHLSGPGAEARSFRFDYFAGQVQDDKSAADLEALTRDPVDGRLWAAYEGRNLIERHESRFLGAARIRPEAMRRWPDNAGPEAMVRLRDGRFIVLAEASPRWFAADSPALLFAGDPVERTVPLRFRFAPPSGFRPVDIAELPDGRVLILLRDVRLDLPPRFVSRLVLADPADIRANTPWRGETVAEIASPVPSENYEGLAIEWGDTDGPTIWLISDDNGMRHQRTLLLRFAWPGYTTARASRRAPR